MLLMSLCPQTPLTLAVRRRLGAVLDERPRLRTHNGFPSTSEAKPMGLDGLACEYVEIRTRAHAWNLESASPRTIAPSPLRATSVTRVVSLGSAQACPVVGRSNSRRSMRCREHAIYIACASPHPVLYLRSGSKENHCRRLNQT